MRVLNHLDLFTGIGGFALAARWMGWETVGFVEIDEWCQSVLRKRFKNVPIYGDIKTTDFKQFRGSVDIITGGFPCQPFSYAGSREQKEDERYLWPEMYRVVREVKPKYVIAENVSGIADLVDEICSDLENAGYKVEPVSIEASCIGSDNLRERYWFVAYPSSMGWENVRHEFGALHQETWNAERTGTRSEQWQQATNVMDTLGNPFLQFEERFGEPAIFGEYDGLPKRLDVSNRLKGLGNAIDPRVAFELFKAIDMIDKF